MEAPDEGEDILEDFSDGLEALTAVPVWFLSTWVYIHFCTQLESRVSP